MEKDFTTFYMDFTIADHFGIEAIKDTFNRAFEEWKTDYKYLTFLVLNLNNLIIIYVILGLNTLKSIITHIATIMSIISTVFRFSIKLIT